MTQHIELEVGGLVTEPSALNPKRSGALRRAEGVLLNRPGLILPRPGFPSVLGYDGSTAYRIVAMVAFANKVVAVSYNGSAWRLERVESPPVVLTGAATPPDIDLITTRFAEARRSLYYTSSTGTQKLTSPADAAEPAGVEMLTTTLGGQAGIAGTGFTGPASWAYRVVFVRTDSNGYIRRSSPSRRIIGRTTTVGAFGGVEWATYPNARVYLPSWLVAGDVVEFYRSRMTSTASGTVPPAHFLAFAHTLTATDIANGYITPTDDAVPDAQLGAALYADPSQEGALAAKEPPPIAHDVALWQRCAWFANVTGRHRLTRTLKDVGGITAINATGIQRRTLTGDFATGSPNVTNVPSITGLVEGMALTDAAVSPGGPTVAGTLIPAGTKIQSISGAGPYTIVMTQNALANGVGATFYACDIVTVDGTEFYAWFSVTSAELGATYARCFIASDDADPSIRASETAVALEYAINYDALINARGVKATALGANQSAFGTSGGSGELLFEEIRLGRASAFVVSSTRPDAWDAPLTAAGASSDNDARADRVAYSLPDEPEAVPLLAHVYFGSERDRVLRLLPLRSSLVVFTERGIYRVTGGPPDAWRVDTIAPSTRLLRAECACELDGLGYAWTDRGVVRIDESGIELLSLPIRTELQASADLYPVNVDLSDPTRGAWMVAHPNEGLVLLAVPEEMGADVSLRSYVLAVETGAWATWALAARAMVYDPVRQGLLLAYATGDGQRPDVYLVHESDREKLHDGSYTAITITVVGTPPTAFQWAKSLTPQVEPRVGDTIRSGFSWWRVTGVSTVGASWQADVTLITGDAVPSSSLVLYSVVTAEVEWQAIMPRTPAGHGLWRELQVSASDVIAGLLAAVLQLEVGASGPLSSSPSTSTKTVSDAIRQSDQLRVGLAREVARATHLYPYLRVRSDVVTWRAAGLTAIFEPSRERAMRR